MIGTARQLHGPAHHTNAPFNAIAKPLAVLEPGLLFIRSALRGFGAGLGQGNLFHYFVGSAARPAKDYKGNEKVAIGLSPFSVTAREVLSLSQLFEFGRKQ